MCFNVDSRHKKSKVAKHNILVRKMLLRSGERWVAPYRHTNYEFGVLYTVPGVNPIHVNGCPIINAGLHSYTTIESVKAPRKSYYQFYEYAFYGIIPKGTRFFFDPNRKEIVSEALVIFETLKDALKACGQKKVSDIVKLRED